MDRLVSPSLAVRWLNPRRPFARRTPIDFPRRVCSRPVVPAHNGGVSKPMALAEARPVSLALADGAARHSFARITEVAPIPNLIKVQRDSFEWFLREGLKELFAEISPIQDFTSRNMDLELAVPGPDAEPGYSFGQPKMSEDDCREHDLTYAAPLKVRMRLKIKSGENAGEIKEQDIFMGDFPLMTDNGTFIINGAERVVVSQLVRSPGVYFTVEEDPTSGRDLCMGKLIPSRGAWLEFETSSRDVMSVKVDRKRKIPVTTLLRALPRVVPEFTAVARGTDEEILALFEGVDEGSDHRFRPGDPPNADNARSLLNSLFFNFRRYDLGKVGRYKVNKRLGLQTDITVRILTPEDLVEIVREMVRINHGKGTADDIDHLGNRRAVVADQHPPLRGKHARVLRRQPAEPVQGTVPSRGRADRKWRAERTR